MENINKLHGLILEHKAYLYSTDYLVIRNNETGKDIPEDIKSLRAEARSEINRLESEIKILEEHLKVESDNVQL